MTREEARQWLKIELKLWEDECKSKHPIKEALGIAIKTLEQEPILDKIRAEIKNDWQLKESPCSPFSCGLRQAIEIIDKYREEVHHMVSEVKDV